MPKQQPALRPMQLLDTRYRVIRQHGQGGFGTVYQAEDTLLNLTVAIKEVQGDADIIGHARHEARLLASLKHSSIPSFIDFFEQHGRWYVVMEWVTGVHVWGRKPLRVKQVIWFGVQLCDVLSYLHHCQPPVIHRDLTPANILLTPQSHLYLIDFGISCAPGPAVSIAGSPGYGAPEQWIKGQSVTPLADIYSMGIILRQLLTGKAPSSGGSTTQVRKTNSAVPQTALQPGYRELLDLLERMTADEACQRPDIEAVWQRLEALDAFVSGAA